MLTDLCNRCLATEERNLTLVSQHDLEMAVRGVFAAKGRKEGRRYPHLENF